jgi:DNA-directed RNA polymerase specialized sigma24 family protein
MKSSEMYTPAPAAVIAGGQTALLNEAEIEQCYCNESLEVGEDEWLVQGCIQGDHEAWEALIDKYKRLIFSIPIKYGASSADAADVFQAVCIEVLNSLPQLKNVQSLRSWLITVTIRQAYRWKKKQINHVELDAMEPDVAEALASIPPVETLEQL